MSKQVVKDRWADMKELYTFSELCRWVNEKTDLDFKVRHRLSGYQMNQVLEALDLVYKRFDLMLGANKETFAVRFIAEIAEEGGFDDKMTPFNLAMDNIEVCGANIELIADSVKDAPLGTRVDDIVVGFVVEIEYFLASAVRFMDRGSHKTGLEEFQVSCKKFCENVPHHAGLV
ncbi:MAG: hypothetical protein Q9204_002263 [Flavoplaca sp. TL-2023a]